MPKLTALHAIWVLTATWYTLKKVHGVKEAAHGCLDPKCGGVLQRHATDLNKCGGRILDAAAAKGAVQIRRRGQEFILMRKDHLASLLEAAQDSCP